MQWKDGMRKDSMLEQDTKNEMETVTQNRNITEWKMAEKGCWMEPGIELKIQDQQSDWKTKKKMGRWYQRIPSTRNWRTWKPNREQKSNQQNLDQHSQRQQKMGSIRRNLHNDRGRTTEVKNEDTANITKSKRKWDDDYGKRSSSATPLRMHQQNDACESSSRPAFKNFAMGWRLMVKNNVTSSLQWWRYWVRILRTKERKFGWESGVTDELRYLPTSSSGVCCCFLSWFPWPVCHPLGFPDFVVLLRIRGFQRSEFVNSCQQQPVRR